MTNPIPIRLPLLMDGEINPEPDYPENTDFLKSIKEKYVLNGCDIISAPTESFNRIKLSSQGKVSEYNNTVVSLTKSVSANTLTAGAISPTGGFIEPLGDISFSEAIDIFYEQASVQKHAGADLFIIKNMDSIGEIRAAVIACNKLNLPVFVVISVDRFGNTQSDSTALSYLIPLQEMGVSAFGISSDCRLYELSLIINELVRHSKIPIIALPSPHIINDDDEYILSPEEFAEEAKMLLENGAEIIGGSNEFSPEYCIALKKLIADFEFDKVFIEKEDTSLILSNAKQVFYLSPDGIEISEPVICSVDMADVLLEFSNTNIDVIRVDVITSDDAYQFSQNAYMSKLPIIFHSDDKSALKLALLSYHGRAMIDKECDIDYNTLEKISYKYGAVIY